MTRNGHSIYNESDPSAFSDHERTSIAQEDSGSIVTMIASRYDLTEEEATTLVAEIQEAFGGADAPEDSGIKFVRIVRRGLREIMVTTTNARQRADKLAYLILALGWTDLLDGVHTPTELGKRLGLTKANADKFVNLFRDIVNDGSAPLPTSGGQRKEEHRAKFTQKRQEQESQRPQLASTL